VKAKLEIALSWQSKLILRGLRPRRCTDDFWRAKTAGHDRLIITAPLHFAAQTPKFIGINP
jgi:hypothetical protein